MRAATPFVARQKPPAMEADAGRRSLLAGLLLAGPTIAQAEVGTDPVDRLRAEKLRGAKELEQRAVKEKRRQAELAEGRLKKAVGNSELSTAKTRANLIQAKRENDQAALKAKKQALAMQREQEKIIRVKAKKVRPPSGSRGGGFAGLLLVATGGAALLLGEDDGAMNEVATGTRGGDAGKKGGDEEQRRKRVLFFRKAARNDPTMRWRRFWPWRRAQPES